MQTTEPGSAIFPHKRTDHQNLHSWWRIAWLIQLIVPIHYRRLLSSIFYSIAQYYNYGDGLFSCRSFTLRGFNSPLMLNYLERSGTFKREQTQPSGHGKIRNYTLRDIIVLRAINRLLELGARPKRIAAAIATFERLENLPTDTDSLKEFANRSSFFVVTNDQILHLNSANEIVELAKKGQLAFSFMLDTKSALGPVSKTVIAFEKAVDSGKARNSGTLRRLTKAAGL